MKTFLLLLAFLACMLFGSDMATAQDECCWIIRNGRGETVAMRRAECLKRGGQPRRSPRNPISAGWSYTAQTTRAMNQPSLCFPMSIVKPLMFTSGLYCVHAVRI